MGRTPGEQCMRKEDDGHVRPNAATPACSEDPFHMRAAGNALAPSSCRASIVQSVGDLVDALPSRGSCIHKLLPQAPTMAETAHLPRPHSAISIVEAATDVKGIQQVIDPSSAGRRKSRSSL